MIKETVTYTNFDGDEVQSDLYFNMSKMEILTLGVQEISGRLQKMVQEKDILKILEYTKDIVHDAYGERSEDGKRFVKNAEILERFKSSPAYDEFLFSIVTDAEKQTKFIRALFPEEVIQAMSERIKAGLDKVNKETI